MKKVIPTFEQFCQINEGIQSDVKKFIKKYQDELEELADADEWDRVYSLLYQEFDVEEDGRKAKDLKQTFDFMF